MSIVSDIESQVGSLRAKLGGLAADTEAYFTEFFNRAKVEEQALDAKVSAEIAHLTDLGYAVTAPAAPAADTAPVADPATP